MVAQSMYSRVNAFGKKLLINERCCEKSGHLITMIACFCARSPRAKWMRLLDSHPNLMGTGSLCGKVYSFAWRSPRWMEGWCEVDISADDNYSFALDIYGGSHASAALLFRELPAARTSR